VVYVEDALRRIRSVADYQFGKDVGGKLFPENVEIAYSKRTGRIRYVYLDGKRLATLRPMDGLFSLSIEGAKRIIESGASAKCIVTVKNDVSRFIANGGDVFAVHVVKADNEIRPKDEVIVVNEKGEVLAVGRAVLSGEEMKAFKVGVAVKVRRGCMEES
jgi:predicted RNA-binding protein (TIGR00451 family)